MKKKKNMAITTSGSDDYIDDRDLIGGLVLLGNKSSLVSNGV